MYQDQRCMTATMAKRIISHHVMQLRRRLAILARMIGIAKTKETMMSDSKGLDGTGMSTPHTVENVKSVDDKYARTDVPHGDYNNKGWIKTEGPNSAKKGGGKQHK